MKKLIQYLSKCGISSHSCRTFDNGIIIPWQLCSKVTIGNITPLLPDGFDARVMNPRPQDMLEAQTLGVSHQCAIAISRGDDAFAHLEELV